MVKKRGVGTEFSREEQRGWLDVRRGGETKKGGEKNTEDPNP